MDGFASIEGPSATGSVTSVCRDRPRSGRGSGGGSSAAGRWDRYCSQFGAYGPGRSASITRGGLLTSATAHEPSITFDGRSYTGTTSSRNVATGMKLYNWTVTCITPTTTNVRIEVGPGAGPLLFDPFALRDAAMAKISIPEPAFKGSPPLDDPDRHSVVRIPTWFWLDETANPWQPITATAGTPPASVTVTATPMLAAWDPGDGEPPVICDGSPDQNLPDMVAWDTSRDEDDSDCKHTYLKTSNGAGANDTFDITVSVLWEYSWAINTGPLVPFDTYEATETIPHQVGEIQAVGR